MLEAMRKMQEKQVQSDQLILDMQSEMSRRDRPERSRELHTKGMKTKVFSGVRDDWEDFGFSLKVGLGRQDPEVKVLFQKLETVEPMSSRTRS